jgi:3-hydroxyacyl-CoA dehydrogenase
MEINNIGILGAGIMGSGIAQVTAMSGLQVVIRDLKEEFLNLGRLKVNDSLKRMVKKEKINEEQAEKIVNNIKWTTDINNLSGIEFLIEAIP